jgi:4-amino-4-deoxy-L-arabinose transferase-like glycosyltransferase
VKMAAGALSDTLTAALDRATVSPWLLAAALALAFFWQLGAVPLYDLDEGAFTEATREMIASGNYITPQKDGAPRYDKPVLIYWLQALSAKLFGFNELALRLPSALAATQWVLVLWIFVRERIDAPTATVAGLVMALSLQVSLIAKAAVADALLNLFIALTFFEIYRYYLATGGGGGGTTQDGRRFVWRAYLWMGLGFLTKGPVAVFFPLVVSLLYFWSQAALKRWAQAVLAPLGWLIFILVAGPWYLAIYLDDGPGFFQSFFLKHNAGRFGEAMHGHSGFFGYYLVLLPVILLPFSGWFLRLLPPHSGRLGGSPGPLPMALVRGGAPVFLLLRDQAAPLSALRRDSALHPDGPPSGPLEVALAGLAPAAPLPRAPVGAALGDRSGPIRGP